MNSEIFLIREKLKESLNPGRYEHSLSVSFTCMALAMKYGYDLDKAELAGLLHDCAKCYDNKTIIEVCRNKGLELTEGELQAPSIIHSRLGAQMAKEKFGITDPEILSAIACHTTGKPDMSLLDKILYIADYIEPRRYKVKDLPSVRCLAFEDLDQALFQIMEGTLRYLNESGTYADIMTQNAYYYYKKQMCTQSEVQKEGE
ncbi:MAG: bis(5'-nucleosyl)-tetraphosphatase (symmetrical) YqeK [Clostridium sp.]|nr:bis(5'-nucleosyl)-tetraphosphatase (symmetrical) YqeK [Clostridium sp.]